MTFELDATSPREGEAAKAEDQWLVRWAREVGWPHMAMGHQFHTNKHPNPTTEIGNLRWVVNSPTPKWYHTGFDPQP